jgi:hypothetical protein
MEGSLMPRYQIYVQNTISAVLEVNAADVEEAEDMAWEIMPGNVDFITGPSEAPLMGEWDISRTEHGHLEIEEVL